MSEPRMYSERELILAKREAFARAHAGHDIHTYHAEGPCWRCERSRRIASEQYPLPKISRPRVVRDVTVAFGSTCLEFRIDDSRLESRIPGDSDWRDAREFYIDATRAHLIVDLFANPTETVEDDSR